MVLVLASAISGCGGKAAVPGEFCGVPVQKESLARLLPDGESLKNWHADLQAVPGMACSISIDGTRILYTSVQQYSHAPEPLDPKLDLNYRNGKKRQVSFRGEAFIGSDGSVVAATCDDPNSYLSVVVKLAGSRVEDTPDGYKKIQPFIEDLVPREAKKYGCTK